MKDGLYHREVYWTEEIQKQIDAVLNSGLQIKFSKHAIDEQFIRSISTSNITVDKLRNGYCFEASVENDKVVKFVIRYGFNETEDLSSVWIPRTDCLFCKTVWFNKRDDKHETLDINKYVTYNDDDIRHVSTNIGDLIKKSYKRL